ncbi:unnamed protein product, partial [Symbiodinium necroappetens]
YLQIGHFRLGYTGSSVVILNAKGGMGTDRLIEQWHSNGHLDVKNVPALTNRGLRFNFVNRSTHKFPCPQIGDLAFGPCDQSFGAWGDRFVQLGEFRLAAIDFHHFSGTDTHLTGRGPTADFNAWSKEFVAGPAAGVRFGDHFIELHGFHIGSVRHDHKDYLTISNPHFHGGQFSHTCILASGGMQTHLHFDGLYAGPHARVEEAPKGITFGDRFVQIGKFRIGDVDGKRFYVAHVGEDESDEGGKYHLRRTMNKDDGSHVYLPAAPAENEAIGDTTVAPLHAVQGHRDSLSPSVSVHRYIP